MSESLGSDAASSGAYDQSTCQLGPNRNDAGSPSADRPTPNDPRPNNEQIASLCEELRQRWQRGEQVPAEAYLDAFPDVAGNEGTAVEVILAEVWLRRERGQAPDPDEYRRRFPNLAAALEGSWRLAGKAPGTPTDPFLDGLPGYEILGELGRGGMGVVYKARNVKLDRIVAIKGVHLERVDARARFRLEARAVAALQHPGIVQIHEVGEHRGQPYYVMQFVEGGSLAERMARTNTASPWSRDARAGARLVEQLARAVHHAHTRGIVHRDLKPSNVLLAADGSPRVADFGLVKWVEDEAEAGAREALTEPGIILGTPCYMAPEQASGGGSAVGPAADVYALGAILYHLLADRPPFAAGSSLDSLILVRTAEPVPPSRLIHSCPRDVETICLKCLEKDPVRRYGSAGELADDLQRFLDGVPVQARPLGTVGRGVKWARRHPAIAALSAVVVLSLAVCFGLVVVWWREAERANSHLHALAREEQRGREAAQLAAVEQRRQRERAEQQLYVHLLAAAEREWLLGDTPRAHHFLGLCPEPLRRWEWHHLARRFEGSRLTLEVPGSPVPAAVAFRPGRPNVLATGGGDGAVRFWEAGRETGAVAAALGPVLAVAFSPDGSRLAAGGPDGRVRVIDVEARREMLAFRAHDVSIVSIAFSPDGTRLAIGARDPLRDATAHEARVFDAHTGRLQFACSGHQGTVFAVAYSPDGKLLATGSHDRMVRLWDASSGRERAVLKGHEDLVAAVAFSPDGARLASAGFDRTVRLWDVAKRAPERTLVRHSQAVLGVAFSPDGRRLASGSWDRTLRVWDAATGEPLGLRKGHREPVQAVAFSPDGLDLVSAARGGEVKVWDAGEGSREHPVLSCGRDWVPAAVFFPDGLLLASAYRGDKIAIWDVRDPGRAKTDRPLLHWRAHDEDVFGLAVTSDGDLVSCASDGWLKVWDARTGTLRRQWKGHDGVAYAVAAAPDGVIASGGGDGRVKLWDVRTGTLLRECAAHGDEVTSVAFSPDGTRLVSGSADGTARVSETATGRERVVFRAHGSKIHEVAFAPDGKRIASASGDRERRGAACDVRIWDAETGEQRLRLSDGSAVFWCLAFSPDGSRVVTGNDGGVVKVWDAESGGEVLSLVGHLADDLRCLAFTPDGRFLASAGDDEQIILWDARAR